MTFGSLSGQTLSEKQCKMKLMEMSLVCYILQPKKTIKWLKNKLEVVEKELASNVKHCLK